MEKSQLCKIFRGKCPPAFRYRSSAEAEGPRSLVSSLLFLLTLQNRARERAAKKVGTCSAKMQDFDSCVLDIELLDSQWIDAEINFLLGFSRAAFASEMVEPRRGFSLLQGLDIDAVSN